MNQRLPDPQDSILPENTEFTIIGYNSINSIASSIQPFVRMSVYKVAYSECAIGDNGVDYCVKIPLRGYFIQQVMALCKFGGKEMTNHWIIYLFIIIFDIE